LTSTYRFARSLVVGSRNSSLDYNPSHWWELFFRDNVIIPCT
jgi:hypothetical protein